MACKHQEILKAVAFLLEACDEASLKALCQDCREAAEEDDPPPTHWRDVVEKAVAALQIFDPSSETGKAVFREVQSELRSLLETK